MRPREPPTTSTSPELNLVELASRRGASARAPARDQPRGGLGRRAGRDPDRRHADLAGTPLTRCHPVAELGGVEGDREVGAHRDSLDLPGGGVDAGGDVGGHHRRVTAVDRLDREIGGRPRRPLEAGAEDRVDDDPGALEGGREPAGLDLAGGGVDAVEVGGGIGRELVSRPQQERLDLMAGARQVAGGDEAVATVVALAADDARGTRSRDRLRRFGDRSAGRLHQLERWNPTFVDRPSVDGAHPRRVEEGLEPGLDLGPITGHWQPPPRRRTPESG